MRKQTWRGRQHVPAVPSCPPGGGGHSRDRGIVWSQGTHAAWGSASRTPHAVCHGVCFISLSLLFLVSQNSVALSQPAHPLSFPCPTSPLFSMRTLGGRARLCRVHDLGPQPCGGHGEHAGLPGFPLVSKDPAAQASLSPHPSSALKL